MDSHVDQERRNS